MEKATTRSGVYTDTGPFAIVPEWLLDAEISDRAVRLYALLARYSDREGRSFPRRRKLAERLRCSTGSLDRARAELVEIGALEVEPRYVPEGEQTSNLYLLRRMPPGGGTPLLTGAEGGSRMDEETPLLMDGEPENESQSEREPEERDREGSAVLVDPRTPIDDHVYASGGEGVWKVDRKPVLWQHARLATEVLAAWNEATGQDLRARTWLAKIVMRVREYPEATLDDHRFIIERALANPWWKGAPTPSVIYGSDAQFERQIQEARQPTGGEAFERTVAMAQAVIDEARRTA